MKNKKINIFLLLLGIIGIGIGSYNLISSNKQNTDKKIEKEDKNHSNEHCDEKHCHGEHCDEKHCHGEHCDEEHSDEKQSHEEHKKTKEVIVTYIAEDGYSWLHGDHSHFKKGKIPFDAKFLDKVVLKDENYSLRNEDIAYEVKEGYIIKVDGEFYYYPKKEVTQTSIISEDNN